MENQIVIQIGKKGMFLHAVRNLAKLVYDEKDVSELSKYAALYKKCPEAFIFAFDRKTNLLVGYIINIPIKEAYFKQSTQPDFKEQNFSQDVIEPYKSGNNFTYIFSIVAQPKHPLKLTILKELCMAYLEQMRSLSNKGKYVIAVSALALTEVGQKLCRGLQMDELGSNEKGVVFVNKAFNKVYTDELTKENILKKFVYYKRIREQKKSL